MKSVATNLSALLERFVGLLVMVMTLPTLLVLALILRANSDAPVLLTDQFVAKGGRPVQIYRFRTTGRGTPAFRRFGRWLRRFSLDQIPGFLSVALGQCGLMDVQFGVRKP
jgi:lipopolysaccharide/colanic/teichoic acid biosynthesis glycosyltransferase